MCLNISLQCTKCQTDFVAFKFLFKMVAGGIQPNWRHIFLALVIIAVIWYTFYGSKFDNPSISHQDQIQKVNFIGIFHYDL